MTPIKQDIVDAAKRAGIPVRIMTTGRVSPDVPSFEGWLCIAVGPDHYYVDQPEGSALFIVAVLGVLRPMKVRLNLDIDDTEIIILSDESGGYSEFHGDTLTDACAHALVAAYPAKETAPE